MKGLKIYFILLTLLFLSGCSLAADSQFSNTESKASQPVNNNHQPNQPTADQTIYYFSYGSNMSTVTIESRCGKKDFSDLGKAALLNYQLYFMSGGSANIKPDQNFQVEGVLYKISQSCFDALDQAEGYPNYYNRQLTSVNYQGQSVSAQVYIILNDQTSGQPSDGYYEIVLKGAKEHQLSDNYINYLKEIAGKNYPKTDD